MAEIYGIFQGQYSDWKCVGYFDDEQSAWKYCKMRNETLDDYDRLYVVPIRKIVCDLSNVPNGYFVYQFTFHFKDGVWKLFPDYYRNVEEDYEDERLIDFVSDYFCPYISEKKFSTGSVIHVRVCVMKADMKEAQRIAYQTMHEFHFETDGAKDG